MPNSAPIPNMVTKAAMRAIVRVPVITLVACGTCSSLGLRTGVGW